MDIIEKKLTIVIPTYNRKDSLLKLLEGLSQQGQFDKYKILISDNHSDYDVKQAIEDKFSQDFESIIKVNRWSFNTSQAFNMTAGMLFVDTKWCWLISDDDTFTENAIQKGLEDIEKYPDMGAIRYSLNCCFHDDVVVKNLQEYIEYYNSRPNILGGEPFYIGGLFNMVKLRPHLTYTTMYSYTYISFVIPFLKSLEKQESHLLFSSFQAYNYNLAVGDGWYNNPLSHLRVMLGIRTFYDIPFNLPIKEKKCLRRILTGTVLRDGSVYRILSAIQDREIRLDSYKQLEFSIKSVPWHKPILKTIFYIQYYLGINLWKLFKKTK